MRFGGTDAITGVGAITDRPGIHKGNCPLNDNMANAMVMI